MGKLENWVIKEIKEIRWVVEEGEKENRNLRTVELEEMVDETEKNWMAGTIDEENEKEKEENGEKKEKGE